MLTELTALRDIAAELDASVPTVLANNPYRSAPTTEERIDYLFARNGADRSIASLHIERSFDEIFEIGGRPSELDSQGISCFEDRINSIADQTLAEKDFVPALEIDADIDFSEISFNLTKDFAMLEPFGFGNPEPLLGSKGLEILYPRILKDTH